MLRNQRRCRIVLKDTLIVAPHADDELIGCYTVLRDHGPRTDVAVMYETTEARMAEAQHCARLFGHSLVPQTPLPPPKNYKNVYVPSIRDLHPAHKEVNRRWRTYATHYYSVDMGDFKTVLDAQNQQHKRCALDTAYPSQGALWQNDASYYLFESIRERDFVIQRTIRFGQTSSCVVPDEYYASARRWLSENQNLATDARLFNALVSLFSCSSMTDGDTTYTF